MCRTYYGIGYERMRNCRNWLSKFVICARPHKVEDHQCGVFDYHKKPGKICVHVKIQCADFGDSHPADSNQCNLRHKAEINTCRKKTLNKSKRKIVKPIEQNHKSQKTSPKPEIRMDLEAEGWAKHVEEESSNQDKILEGIDHA